MSEKKEIIWVVDDDQAIRWVCEQALITEGYEVCLFNDAESLLEAIQVQPIPCVVVSDIRMKGVSGTQMLSQLKQVHSALPVIIMTAHSDLDSAVSAFDSGAFDYLPKPFDLSALIDMVGKAVQSLQPVEVSAPSPADNAEKSKESSKIIGESPAMQQVFRAVGRVARSNVTVLINGESGTGKERVAGVLHESSSRAEQPFVAINMAAIPKELMEAELFGYEKGAFTGALERKAGHFERADGGTLFLDEIGDMPLELQTRLLRVLSEGAFYRVGGREPVHVDVRIITATHQSLSDLMVAGRFREDLYYRLNVVRIELPPLRERKEDIPQLIEFFLSRAAQELAEPPKHISPKALRYMENLDWQGNIRQLENTCRWLTVMVASQRIEMEDLPSDLQACGAPKEGASTASWEQVLHDRALKSMEKTRESLSNSLIPEIERVLIRAALSHSGGMKNKAANCLGWGRNTLTRKMKSLGMND